MALCIVYWKLNIEYWKFGYSFLTLFLYYYTFFLKENKVFIVFLFSLMRKETKESRLSENFFKTTVLFFSPKPKLIISEKFNSYIAFS